MITLLYNFKTRSESLTGKQAETIQCVRIPTWISLGITAIVLKTQGKTIIPRRYRE